MKKIAKIAAIGAVVFGATIATPTLAEELVTPIEKLVSEMAEKPEHHAAIADYYKEKAATARADAATHRKMAGMAVGHSKSPISQQNWRTHCEKLASSLEAAAKEFDTMASFHDASAK